MTKAITILALALGAFSVGRTFAEEAAGPAAFSAAVGNRYIYMTDRGKDKENWGSRAFVSEYDGRQYDYVEGSVDLSLAGEMPIFDAPYSYFKGGVAGINTTEESAYLDLGIGGGFRLYGDFDTITHRTTYQRYGLLISDGVFFPNRWANGEGVAENWKNNGGGPHVLGRDFYFQRRFAHLGMAFRVDWGILDNVYVEYRHISDQGKTYSLLSNGGYGVYETAVDRLTRDYRAGVGIEAGRDSGATYEYWYRDFKDYVFGPYRSPPGYTNIDQPVHTQWPHLSQNVHAIKFRCNPSNDLSFSGSLTNNDRKNLVNGVRNRTFTGTLNALYAGIKDLTLAVRLLSRNTNLRENKEFWAATGDQGTGDRRINTDLIDKFTFRGQLAADYHLMKHVKLKGSYKVEANRRVNVGEEVARAYNMYFTDGLNVGAGAFSNAYAQQDTKQRFNAGIEAQLPFDIEVGAEYRRLWANRAVFENMPTWQEVVGGSLYIPMPLGFWTDFGLEFLGQRNAQSDFFHHSQFGRTYTAGLGWAGMRGSASAHYSNEKSKTYAEGYYDTSGAGINRIHDGSQHYKNENNAFSFSGRANLPKGFVLKGMGSYTISRVNVPVDLGGMMRTVAAAGDDVGLVADIGPGHVRSQSVSFGVDYTPEKFKRLTLSTNIRSDRFINRYDNMYGGKVDIYDVGVNLAF